MASLIEKLGSTISGKVSGSISGFGAGAKSAFIGANPALFAPIAGVMYKGFEKLIASNAAVAKQQDDKEERTRGFREETDRENSKIFSDMQKSLNSIDKNVLTILELLKAGKEKERGSGLDNLLKGLAVGGLAAVNLPKTIVKGLASGIGDTIKAFKSLVNALTPKFLKDFFLKIPDFFKNIPDFLKGFFDKFGKYFDDLFNASKLKFNDLFNKFGKYFDDLLAGAKLKFGNLFDKFGKYFDELSDALRLKFPTVFAKIDSVIGRLGSYFDELLAAFNQKLPDSIKKLGQAFDDAKAGLSFEGLRTGILAKVADFKTSLLTKVDDLARLFKDASLSFDLGTVVKNVDEFKYLFSESGFIGKIAVTLGTIQGMFSAVGTKFMTFVDDFVAFISGPVKFLGELTALSDIARLAEKILVPIGKVFRVLAGPWVQGAIAIFDGISAAFNEEEISKSLKKNIDDVNFIDRLNAFWAGVIGGAIGGLMDLGVTIYNWIAGTKHKADYQERITSSMLEMFDSFQNALLDGVSGMLSLAIDYIPFISEETRASLKNKVKRSVKTNSNVTQATAARTGVELNSQGRTADPRALANMPSIAQQTVANRAPVAAAPVAAPAPAQTVQPSTTPISSVYASNEKVPLSVRNNNPGNLRYVEALTKPGYVLEGAVRGEGGFAAFSSPEAGMEAMRKQIFIDTQKRGLTVSQFLNKYAPASENDTQGYINTISRSTGLGANDTVPASAIPALMKSMITMEGGAKAASFYYGGSAGASSPQVAREQKKTVEAVQTTAVETVEIRRANEEQARILSDMGMEVENGTQLHQIHLDKLAAYQKENRAEAQKQTELLKQTTVALSPEQQQRKNLETQFLKQVESDIRGALTKALGPAGMGVTGQNASSNAYATYGSLLEKPFSKALTNVFGESGGAYGQIFSKLAGTYITQSMNTILPAMGIDAGLFNRALSNYTQGKQARDQYKLAQNEYNIAKAEYDGASAKVTLADRMNATRPNGVSEVKRLQIAKVDALESALQQKGASLNKAKKAKDANRAMYTEDLIYAMTGMPTGIRSMMGYETGMDQMTQQLTMMIGGPVAQSMFGAGGFEQYASQYRQLYEGQLQGQVSVAEQTAAIQGQVGINTAEMQLAAGQQHAKMVNQVLMGHTNRLGHMMGIGGSGSMIPGSMPGMIGGGMGMPGFSQSDMMGSFFGSMISNKMGIQGPAAGIISSGLGDLFTGQGFGRTAGYIQGPNNFASSLFNMYSLKNADTSTFGGALNTGLAAYQLYNALASGSIASSVGSLASSMATASGATYGTAIGSQQSMMLAGQEAGMAAAPGSGAATAGSVAGYAAGAVGGHYVGRAISNGYSVSGSGNGVVNAGTAIGMYFGGPVGALIGGAIGGTVNRLFGRKPREVTGSGLQVSMGGAAGASGQQYEDWMKKGGKYRSDKSGRDFSAIDPALLKYLNRTTEDMQESFGAIGKTMGLDENALKGFERYYDISFKGLNSREAAEKLQETMQTYAADMIKTQYGDVSKFAKEIIDKDTGEVRDETTLETFERLGQSAQMVDYWMRGFGITAQQTTKLLENLIPSGTASLLESFATSNDAKLQLANLKGELVSKFGGDEAFGKEMGEAFNALYTNEEKAIFARDNALENVKTAFEKIEVPAEIQALLDSFGAGNISTAEDVEEARLAYRAAIDAAVANQDVERFTQLTIAGDQFMEAANMSLQAATMNKDVAEKAKTADEFFGFTAVEDFSQGIANGIAEAAPQMAEGPTSMFNLGSENLTGVVDRSFVAPYYGDGTPISGLVSNAGAGGLGGQGTIVLQPSVIDNSVMSNPSTNIYMDNSAVRDYHPILSIDVRNVTSGYLGLGSK